MPVPRNLHLVLPLAVGPVAGCGTVIDVPAAEPIPIVESLLVADSAVARFRVAVLEHGRPVIVPPDAVRLGLAAPASGRQAVLAPVVGDPFRFEARLPIERGARYVLSGTILGRAVRAEANVPRMLDVLAPADSVLAPPGPAPRVPYHWRAAGARAFYAVGARAHPLQPSTRDTVGHLLVEPPADGAPATSIAIVAVTAEAEAYLFDAVHPRGNLTGGYGYLGAGIAVRRTVRWR